MNPEVTNEEKQWLWGVESNLIVGEWE